MPEELQPTLTPEEPTVQPESELAESPDNQEVAPEPEAIPAPEVNDDIEFVDDGKGPEEDEPATPPAAPETPQSPTSDDIQEMIRRGVQEEIEKSFKTVVEPIKDLRIQNEWSQLVNDYPELKPYESKVLRYASHDKYSNKSVMDALMDVAKPDVFVKIGAKRAKQADEESAGTRVAGGGYRPTATGGDQPSVPSLAGKTPQQQSEIIAQWRAGAFN